MDKPDSTSAGAKCISDSHQNLPTGCGWRRVDASRHGAHGTVGHHVLSADYESDTGERTKRPDKLFQEVAVRFGVGRERREVPDAGALQFFSICQFFRECQPYKARPGLGHGNDERFCCHVLLRFLGWMSLFQTELKYSKSF